MGKLAEVSHTLWTLESNAGNLHHQETRDIRPPFKKRDEFTSGGLAKALGGTRFLHLFTCRIVTFNVVLPEE